MPRHDWNNLIDKYYPAGSRLRDIYMRHSQDVAAKALDIARRKQLPLSEAEIEEAAMLHDIGIFLTNAPGIECHGQLDYICHGTAGADLLRSEGFSEEVARVAERHTGMGLTADDIRRQQLPLPGRDYVPETLLEKLVCYADKFFSKGGGMGEKSFEKARGSVARFGEDSARRFDELAAMFE